MNTQQFTPGQVVKFAVPLTEHERIERFVVLEYRGARPEIGDNAPDRVSVVYICDLPIPPRDVYLASDLVAA